MKRQFLFLFSCFMMIFFAVSVGAKEIKIGRIVMTYNDDLQQMHNGFMDQMERKYGYNIRWPKEEFQKEQPFEKGMDVVRSVTNALTALDPFFYNADLKGPSDAADYENRVIAKAKEMIADGADIIFCEGTYEQVVKATKGKDVVVIDSSLYPTEEAIKRGVYKRTADGNLYCAGNATGTMLYYPVNAICDFITSLKPGSTIAYFYNDKSYVSRPPSDITAAADERGLGVKSYTFYSTEDVIDKLKDAKEKTDFAFFTNDLFVVGAHTAAMKFSSSQGYPIITAIVPLIKAGALAGMTCSWEKAGRICADKAVEALNGKRAGDIPISVSTEQNVGINLGLANKLGYDVPYDWVEISTMIVE